MDLILKFCNKWNIGPCKKCSKFGRTTIALALCITITVVLFIVLFIAIFSPSNIHDFYTFGAANNKLLIYGYISAVVVMLMSSFPLFFGLKYEKTCLLFIWIVIMTTFWNIHLAVGIVSIVNFIVDGEDQQIAKTPVRSVVLIIVQVVWLLGIALIWFHWRTLMKLSDDTPNLVEFIRERSSLSSEGSEEATERKVAQSKGQSKVQGHQEQTTSHKRTEQSKEPRKEQGQEQTTSKKRTDQLKEQRKEQGQEQTTSGQKTEQSNGQRNDQGREQMKSPEPKKKNVNQ